MNNPVPTVESDADAGSPAQPPNSAGDPLPEHCEPIEIHVAELKQLFNAIDPSPFREKDLDPDAEEFIVSWAREIPTTAALALVVYLDRSAGLPEEPAILRGAIREFFHHRALAARGRLRQLFRRGRTSLVIGVSCVAVSLLLGDLVVALLGEHRLGQIVRESLLIGGWVAMWRPMEVFLYDWWPIRAEVRLADRLSAMPVRIVYRTDARSEKWRWDWPVVSPPVAPAAAERGARRHATGTLDGDGATRSGARD
jgi:hypothetical protein